MAEALWISGYAGLLVLSGWGGIRLVDWWLHRGR